MRGVRHTDRGLSLIEVLVAVALLAVGITATLSAFAQTIAGTDRHRSMVAAEAWVQSAGDYLASSVPRLPCYTPVDTWLLPAYYQYHLRLETQNSEDWPSDRLRVLTPVLYWNGTAFGSGSAYCLETATTNALKAQLVTIEVTSPNGQVTRRLTVVKGP